MANTLAPTQSAPIAPKASGQEPIKDVKSLTELFQTRASALRTFMPQGSALTQERLLKLLAVAASRNPDLLKCSRESIWLAVTRAVELGLEPGNALGHAHLVPFFNGQTKRHECTLIIGYRGLLELVQRGGKVRNVYAQVVHEYDEYEVSFGTDYKLVHKPNLTSDRGDPVFAYSVAIFEDGATDFEVMVKEDIEKRRKSSRAGNDRETGLAKGVWKEWQSEMWQKTVLRRHAARLPMAIERAERLMEVESDSVIGEFALPSEDSVALPASGGATRNGSRRKALESKLAKPADAQEDDSAPIDTAQPEPSETIETMAASEAQAEPEVVVQTNEDGEAAVNNRAFVAEDESGVAYIEHFAPAFIDRFTDKCAGKCTLEEFGQHVRAKGQTDPDLMMLEAARIANGKVAVGEIG